MPKVPRQWAEGRIAAGQCTEDGCGGKTYLIAAQEFSTLWRCTDCRQTFLLTALPKE